MCSLEQSAERSAPQSAAQFCYYYYFFFFFLPFLEFIFFFLSLSSSSSSESMLCCKCHGRVTKSQEGSRPEGVEGRYLDFPVGLLAASDALLARHTAARRSVVLEVSVLTKWASGVI